MKCELHLNRAVKKFKIINNSTVVMCLLRASYPGAGGGGHRVVTHAVTGNTLFDTWVE